MNSQKDISILREASNEIKQLRRSNELLAAKVSVMDLFAAMLYAQPQYNSITCSPCIAHEMDMRVEEMLKENEQELSLKHTNVKAVKEDF